MIPTLRTVATTTHGRYLVAAPEGPRVGLLMGFHGYAEDAAVHMAALQAIPGVERWLAVAIQALHPFYTREQRVVASWMTSQDRELAIADNIAYVERVIGDVTADHGVRHPRVFIGFSQGGAMAYRAAARAEADGLVILAADMPPDVATASALRLPPMLLGRGTTDAWYTAEKHEADLSTLRGVGAQVQSCVFEGGHEWAPAFREATSRYLARFG